ncbi:hypothetical protein J4218_02755 [Candidatus Pacearchaeota archaeon]|nr:hypothetical protein [Candidatus Pacearchaeota archaeon]
MTIDNLVDVSTLSIVEIIPDNKWGSQSICPYAHTGIKNLRCGTARSPGFFDEYCSRDFTTCPIYDSTINLGTPRVVILKIGGQTQ